MLNLNLLTMILNGKFVELYIQNNLFLIRSIFHENSICFQQIYITFYKKNRFNSTCKILIKFSHNAEIFKTRESAIRSILHAWSFFTQIRIISHNLEQSRISFTNNMGSIILAQHPLLLANTLCENFLFRRGLPVFAEEFHCARFSQVILTRFFHIHGHLLPRSAFQECLFTTFYSRRRSGNKSKLSSIGSPKEDVFETGKRQRDNS